jgi:hypothetical protein
MKEPISSIDKQNLILSVGTHRKNRRLLPIQVAQLIEQWKAYESMSTIASELGLRGTSMLNRFLSLLELPRELQPLVIWGNSPGYISFSTAYEITKSRDQNLTKILTKDAIENQRTKEEVRAIRQRYRRSNRDIYSCISEIDERRTKYIPIHVFVGRLPLDELDDCNWENIDFFQILEGLFGKGEILSAAISGDRFSFTVLESSLKPRNQKDLRPENIESFVAKIICQNT